MDGTDLNYRRTICDSRLCFALAELEPRRRSAKLSRYKISYDTLWRTTASARRVFAKASRVGYRTIGRQAGRRKKAKNVGPPARRSRSDGQDQFHLVYAAGTGKRGDAFWRGAWPHSRRPAISVR